MKSKTNKGHILLFKDAKGNIKLVNMILNYKGKYDSYTPVFSNEKDMTNWIKSNKKDLEAGTYFLAEIKEDGKIEY
mgnify:CR=1 FL=1